VKRREKIGRACLSLNLKRAARLVSRRYDEALRPLGLTAGQFSIMTVLLDSEAMSITAVAEVLGMDRTTLTRNLRPLRKRHLIESVEDPEDRRSHGIVLTKSGASLLEAAIPLWEKAQKENLKRLGKGAWPEVKITLDRLG